MQTIATIIEHRSDSDVTVLIRGDSGVGKELVARAIHQHLPRRARSFVKMNCAAVPAELLESELFGHVLQDGQFTKLGSNKAISVADVKRVVAATNRKSRTDAGGRKVPQGFS